MFAPTDILSTTVELWRDGILGPDLAISLQRAGISLAIGLTIGIVTGVLGGFLRTGEYVFNGVAQILNTVPLLAVLPLFVVWFGIDELTKVLLIAFGAGVPMYLNLFAAIRGVDQRLIEMARTTGAGPWRVVTRVLIPGALPGFLVGLRFSLAYSILGLVAAETINADEGLGFLIAQAQTYLQTNKVFVGSVIYSILGLLADQLVRILEQVLLRWRPSYEAQGLHRRERCDRSGRHRHLVCRRRPRTAGGRHGRQGGPRWLPRRPGLDGARPRRDLCPHGRTRPGTALPVPRRRPRAPDPQ